VKTGEVPGREVEVTLTVTGKVIGDRRSTTFTETFPATVRTRLIYEGRPAFLAADPVAEPEEASA
jgi:hypothetical protein